MHQFKSCIWRPLPLVAGLAMAAATPVFAADEETAPIQEVIVTGSRIPQPNLVSTSPIQVISSQEIKQQGANDAITLLQSLPQNFINSSVDFGNSTNPLSAPGGLATADLRGLGPQRTLVLVDGRRLGPGDANTANPNPAPDLDQIPVALIERVEVVTGGASAVYGSDAIAGVVNFIMKKNFEGFQIDGQLGVDQHSNHSAIQPLAAAGGFAVNTGNVRDGRSKSFSLLAGSNLADGKGNVIAYLTYQHAEPVTGRDRDFAGCQLAANLPDPAICIGTSNSNWFAPKGGATYSVVGNQFLPRPQAGSNPPAQFNSNNYIYLSRGDDRYTAGFIAHVDVTDQVQPYAEFGFMNDRTTVVVGPSGLFKNSNPTTPSNLYSVNCGNPLLSAQELSHLCLDANTPLAADADPNNPGSALINIGRRNVEGGGREALFEHTNYRGVAGVKGDLGHGWSYDAYGQYYYTTLFNSNQHYLDYSAIAKALQVTGTAANPVCKSGSPCVPYNIFTEGGVTANQLASLYTPGTAYGAVTEKIIHADVTTDLGEYNARSPWATDGVGANFGYEHRSDFLSFDPDGAELAGNLAGFSGASVAIHNGYSVNEGFLEVRVPIAQGKPWIKDLSLDSGYRYSDYSTAGTTNTYKFEVQYAPLDDVRFRTSFQHAVRTPNIIELYTPLSYGQQSFLGVDPCAPVGSTAATASLVQCAHTGVTAAQYGNGGSTNSIPQCTSKQCGQIIGGNPDLQPETANTYTVGLNLTPTMLPGFSGSIDYYHIDLKQQITTFPGAFLFQQCLQTGDPLYCSQIVRNSATGALTGASVAGGGYIIQKSVNIGAVEVSGIDLQANYLWHLPGAWGSLAAAFNGAELLKTTSTPAPGQHTYDCAGLYGNTCNNGINPKWRHTLRVTWDTPFHTLLSLQWRYIGSVKLDNNDSDPSLNGAEFGVYNPYDARIPAMSYLDLSAIWTVWRGISIRAGINNILDKDPPLIPTDISGTGSPNTYPSYDILGRQAFLGFTARF